jgi:hypothetical protein
MYIIPALNIQNNLVNIENDKRTKSILYFLDEYIEKNSYIPVFRIRYELESQWYPVFETEDVRLANALIRYIAKIG